MRYLSCLAVRSSSLRRAAVFLILTIVLLVSAVVNADNTTTVSFPIVFHSHLGAEGLNFDSGWLHSTTADGLLELRLSLKANPGDQEITLAGTMFVSYPSWVKPWPNASTMPKAVPMSVWFEGLQGGGSLRDCVGYSCSIRGRIPGVWEGDIDIPVIDSYIPAGDLDLCVDQDTVGSTFTPFLLGQSPVVCEDTADPKSLEARRWGLENLVTVTLDLSVKPKLEDSLSAEAIKVQDPWDCLYGGEPLCWHECKTEGAVVAIRVPLRSDQPSGTWQVPLRAIFDEILIRTYSLAIAGTAEISIGEGDNQVDYGTSVFDWEHAIAQSSWRVDFPDSDLTQQVIVEPRVDRSVPSISVVDISPRSGPSPLTVRVTVDVGDPDSGVTRMEARIDHLGQYWLVPLQRVTGSPSFGTYIGEFTWYNTSSWYREYYEVSFIAEDVVSNQANTYALRIPVRVDPAIPCTYSISSTSESFSSAGGTVPVSVTASQPACSWAASSPCEWATVSPTNGTGSGTVMVSVAANFGSTHSCSLTIAGKTYSITQSGTPAAVFRVTGEGSVRADSGVYGSQFLSGSADIAEWVPVSELVEAGDVLELDVSRPGAYRPSQTLCSTMVAGVGSSQPGAVLGWTVSREGMAPLALSGIVPVKVTNEGGPIQPGDLLVSSSTPGYAMRWGGLGPCPCALVGKALEPMTDERGAILVLLTAH
jgi:hypothetical protein